MQAACTTLKVRMAVPEEALPVVEVGRLYDALLTLVRRVSGEFGLLATNCCGISTNASETTLGLRCSFPAHR